MRQRQRRLPKIVGLAALKYGDLSDQAAKDYVFDIDRFISFEGNTGPYILYTIVRIKSILAKYEAQNPGAKAESILPAASDAEKTLMLELSKYNDVMESAFAETAPHKICQYISTCPTPSTASTTIPVSWPKKTKSVRQAGSPSSPW